MIGEKLVSVSRVVDQATINGYAEATDDFNPIHVDPVFAQATPMGGIIAHGTFSLNLIWQSLLRTATEIQWEGVAIDVRFLLPVRVGDTVTAQGVRNAWGGFDVWVENQGGEKVIAGTLEGGFATAETVACTID